MTRIDLAEALAAGFCLSQARLSALLDAVEVPRARTRR